MAIDTYKLVAHRGFQQCFPENSVVGVMSAIEAGAVNVEVDIQLNDEGIIFLLHDSNLLKVSGVNDCVHRRSTISTGQLSSYEPERLGNQFLDNPLNLFAELLPIIRNYKDVDFFIELKESSIIRYGAEACITRMLDLMEGYIDNCIFISSSESAVLQSKALGFRRTGVVLQDWEQRIDISQQAKADYIFMHYTHIPDGTAIVADVPIIVYETVDPEQIHNLIERGAFAVETFNFNNVVAQENIDEAQNMPHS